MPTSAAQADGAKIGRIRLARVSDASAPVLSKAVSPCVATGSRAPTDGWPSYAGLTAKGYLHPAIRTSALVGANLLPRANRVAALLQRRLLGKHQGAVKMEHLDYYVDEFTFRFNRRTSGSRGVLFQRLIDQARALAPVHGDELVGGAKPQHIDQGRQRHSAISSFSR